MNCNPKLSVSQEKHAIARKVHRIIAASIFTRFFKSQHQGRSAMSEFAEKKVITERAEIETSTPTAEPFGRAHSNFRECYSPDPSYRWAKAARDAFDRLSEGDVELLENVYRGDDQRHQVHHRSCGHHSWISRNELETLPPGKWCPHCNPVTDLARYGRMENVQVSVYNQSEEGAYFFASNPLGRADEHYTFWCIRHRRSYETSFSKFQRTRGQTNGCPFCQQGATARD